jgi:hypothetical protein
MDFTALSIREILDFITQKQRGSPFVYDPEVRAYCFRSFNETYSKAEA